MMMNSATINSQQLFAMQSEHSAQYLDDTTPATSGGRSLSAMDPKKKPISTSSIGQRTSAGMQSIDKNRNNK